MSKTLRYIFIGITLVALGLWGWSVVRTTPDAVSVNTDTPFLLPDTTNTTRLVVPTEGTVLRDVSGNMVSVRDFISDHDVAVVDNGVWLIDNENGVTGPLFQTFYFADGGIAITLLQEPLHTARQAAEAALVARTGLSEARLCDFDVRVGTPVSVSEVFSGRDLELSFCEGSVNLQ